MTTTTRPPSPPERERECTGKGARCAGQVGRRVMELRRAHAGLGAGRRARGEGGERAFVTYAGNRCPPRSQVHPRVALPPTPCTEPPSPSALSAALSYGRPGFPALRASPAMRDVPNAGSPPGIEMEPKAPERDGQQEEVGEQSQQQCREDDEDATAVDGEEKGDARSSSGRNTPAGEGEHRWTSREETQYPSTSMLDTFGAQATSVLRDPRVRRDRRSSTAGAPPLGLEQLQRVQVGLSGVGATPPRYPLSGSRRSYDSRMCLRRLPAVARSGTLRQSAPVTRAQAYPRKGLYQLHQRQQEHQPVHWVVGERAMSTATLQQRLATSSATGVVGSSFHLPKLQMLYSAYVLESAQEPADATPAVPPPPKPPLPCCEAASADADSSSRDASPPARCTVRAALDGHPPHSGPFPTEPPARPARDEDIARLRLYSQLRLSARSSTPSAGTRAQLADSLGSVPTFIPAAAHAAASAAALARRGGGGGGMRVHGHATDRVACFGRRERGAPRGRALSHRDMNTDCVDAAAGPGGDPVSLPPLRRPPSMRNLQLLRCGSEGDSPRGASSSEPATEPSASTSGQPREGGARPSSQQPDACLDQVAGTKAELSCPSSKSLLKIPLRPPNMASRKTLSSFPQRLHTPQFVVNPQGNGWGAVKQTGVTGSSTDTLAQDGRQLGVSPRLQAHNTSSREPTPQELESCSSPMITRLHVDVLPPPPWKLPLDLNQFTIMAHEEAEKLALKCEAKKKKAGWWTKTPALDPFPSNVPQERLRSELLNLMR